MIGKTLPCLIVAGCLAWTLASAQTQLNPFEDAEGAVRVVEGDLISVGGKLVRLYGIDAPEMDQTCEAANGAPYDCGEASRRALETMLGDRALKCTIFAVLEDQRAAGLCRHGPQDIAELQVERGWAFAARALSNRYEKAESRAQRYRVGLWRGRAIRPWVWRQRQTLTQQTEGE
ncbi:MAG: thermonuclease family protein [Pseudomonadota bacterium]